MTMATLRPKMSELAKGLTLSNEDVYKIVIPRLTVDVVEMEDIHFHHDSAVVLPWRYGENSETSPDEQHMSGLSVIAAALRYAKANAGRKLLLAGHTDSSGETDYNRKLSKTRGEATQALLKGDRDVWGKACVEHQKVEDLQMTLKWVAEVHGWPCQPGSVDNEMGPKTRAARHAFRKRYNDDFSASLALDADTSAADWKAFLDLYELSLTDDLGDDLKAGRSALTFYDPSILACGEDFAQGGNTPEGMRSASDRRVDLLFLDPGQSYPSFFKETPPGNSIYGPFPWVLRKYLPVDPPVQLSLSLAAIEGLYKPGFVADGDVAPKGSGYQVGYLSDDDLGRIFVNHKPRTDPTQAWDDVTVKDTQYIELCAKVATVQGQIPPDARVEWEWFDPNDAAHPETQQHAAQLPDKVDVEDKPRSMLNRGTCDYPSPASKDMARFAQGGDFGFADGATKNLSDTQVKNGESRVRLHVSNVAGDGFVVQARMKNSPRITPSGQKQTGVMTVWKRIDVEYVRMADAFPLPIDKVPPFFEPARVQMDFGTERVVAGKPFLTTLDEDERPAAPTTPARARASSGRRESPAGSSWPSAQTGRPASSSRRPSSVRRQRQRRSEGDLRRQGAGRGRIAAGGQTWEKLIVDQVVDGKVSFMTVHDVEGGPHGFMGVWKKEVIGGQDPPASQRDRLPIGLRGAQRPATPACLGGPERAARTTRPDYYYLRHRARYPSGAWEPGGMGFRRGGLHSRGSAGFGRDHRAQPVRRVPAARVLRGAAADLHARVRGDFARRGRRRRHDRARVHPCVRVSAQVRLLRWPTTASFSCSMNYFLTWLYEIGTRKLQRFVFGDVERAPVLEAPLGVREVHLEDNPAIWKW